MRSSGLALVVASCDPVETLLPLLRILGGEALVHRAAYPSKGAVLRAYGDILKVAIERVRVAGSQIVLVTSDPSSIQSAKRLGIPSVAFRSGGASAAELSAAAVVYDDPVSLLGDYERSQLALLAASTARPEP